MNMSKKHVFTWLRGKVAVDDYLGEDFLLQLAPSPGRGLKSVTSIQEDIILVCRAPFCLYGRQSEDQKLFICLLILHLIILL